MLISFWPTNDVTSPRIPGLSGNETHNDVLYFLSICFVFSLYCQYFLIADLAFPVLVDESQWSEGETFFEVIILITSPFLNSLWRGLSLPFISHPIAVSPTWVWTAYAKSIGVAFFGNFITDPFGVKQKTFSWNIWSLVNS